MLKSFIDSDVLKQIQESHKPAIKKEINEDHSYIAENAGKIGGLAGWRTSDTEILVESVEDELYEGVHDKISDLIIGSHVPHDHHITDIDPPYGTNILMVKTNNRHGTAEIVHTLRKIKGKWTVLHKANNGKIVRTS